jgi:tRNA pseudouridine55 synthase
MLQTKNQTSNNPTAGILLINKKEGVTSFFLVRILRKLTQVSKIGHAGTLDPMATGVMVMLIGKRYTQKSALFLSKDKEYKARIKLGETTDSYDREGATLTSSPLIPSLSQVTDAIKEFQGEIEQIPPMFSAKKVQGKKLYELARKGVSVERAPCKVTVNTELLDYQYPFVDLLISCSKGTYIRSIAHDLGQKLGSGAHLYALTRTRSGSFSLKDCIDQEAIVPGFSIQEHLRHDDV